MQLAIIAYKAFPKSYINATCHFLKEDKFFEFHREEEEEEEEYNAYMNMWKVIQSIFASVSFAVATSYVYLHWEVHDKTHTWKKYVVYWRRNINKAHRCPIYVGFFSLFIFS